MILGVKAKRIKFKYQKCEYVTVQEKWQKKILRQQW